MLTSKRASLTLIALSALSAAALLVLWIVRTDLAPGPLVESLVLTHVSYAIFLLLLVAVALWYTLKSASPSPIYAIVLLLVIAAVLPWLFMSVNLGPLGKSIFSKLLYIVAPLFLAAWYVREARSVRKVAWFSNSVLILTSVLTIVWLTFVADRVAERFYPREGIIFVPGMQADYETFEFEFSVYINQLGFRDDETTLDFDGDCRFLLLGDSYTYGWGVNHEDTWGKIIEDDLIAMGYDAEVLNLGAPGSGPSSYASLAQVSVPLLNPDFVIVNLLQGDDVNQAPQQAVDYPVQPFILREGTVTGFMFLQYPSIARMMTPRHITPEYFHRILSEQVRDFLAGATPEELERFRSINPEIQEYLETGFFNPALLNYIFDRPGYFVETMDIESEYMQENIDALGEDLRTISNILTPERTHVISVPHAVYTDVATAARLESIAFETTPLMTNSDNADLAIELAVERSGEPLSLLTVTDLFRARTPDEELFFPWDGHFNVAGNRYFAETILPSFVEWCEEARAARAGQ